MVNHLSTVTGMVPHTPAYARESPPRWYLSPFSINILVDISSHHGNFPAPFFHSIISGTVSFRQQPPKITRCPIIISLAFPSVNITGVNHGTHCPDGIGQPLEGRIQQINPGKNNKKSFPLIQLSKPIPHRYPYRRKGQEEYFNVSGIPKIEAVLDR